MTNELLIPGHQPGRSGVLAEVDPQQAGWQYLTMQARRLAAGECLQGLLGDEEQVTVLLGGRCRLEVDDVDQVWELGRRPDVFSGMPHAVYLPRGTRYRLHALSEHVDLASCRVPCEEDHPLQVIRPEQCPVEIRGAGNATRQINGIVPPGFACQRIVCVEVYTPPGSWSSYPPHKHDEHRVGSDGALLEADLEEIYFYQFSHPQGFAYQRVYTGDGRLDELCLARHNDVVLVPEGYHPVVSGPGYTTYYLNFLAGSAQSLANSDDPDHAWLKDEWKNMPADPRVPLVSLEMEKR